MENKFLFNRNRDFDDIEIYDSDNIKIHDLAIKWCAASLNAVNIDGAWKVEKHVYGQTARPSVKIEDTTSKTATPNVYARVRASKKIS